MKLALFGTAVVVALTVGTGAVSAQPVVVTQPAPGVVVSPGVVGGGIYGPGVGVGAGAGVYGPGVSVSGSLGAAPVVGVYAPTVVVPVRYGYGYYPPYGRPYYPGYGYGYGYGYHHRRY